MAGNHRDEGESRVPFRLRQVWHAKPAARHDLGELDRLELRWLEDVAPVSDVEADESPLPDRVLELV
jgi:hypothetical protein